MQNSFFPTNSWTISQHYCSRVRCDPDRFATGLFWAAIRPSRRPIVRLLWWWDSGVFAHEIRMIRRLGSCGTVDEVDAVLRFFHHEKHLGGKSLRNRLGLRVSLNRLRAIAFSMVRSENRA